MAPPAYTTRPAVVPQGLGGDCGRAAAATQGSIGIGAPWVGPGYGPAAWVPRDGMAAHGYGHYPGPLMGPPPTQGSGSGASIQSNYLIVAASLSGLPYVDDAVDGNCRSGCRSAAGSEVEI